VGPLSLDSTQFGVLLDLLLAMVLGGVIGWEREAADKPAGLRTHMLIAGGAALLVALSNILVTSFGAEQGSSLIRSDPVRIIEAVITAAAFLGAGTIIRRANEGEVHGLTTAASLLFTAGVGVSVAVSQYLLAVGATILVLITLRLGGGIEDWLKRRQG
jgi:putative Mg2+ transporter-C (MgtC) family protein